MGLWVRVVGESEEESYYWDPTTDNVAWELSAPEDSHQCWAARKLPDGRFYFWNEVTRETSWKLPPRDGDQQRGPRRAEPDVAAAVPPPRAPVAAAVFPNVSTPELDWAGWPFASYHKGDDLPELQRLATGEKSWSSKADLSKSQAATWVEVDEGERPYFWDAATGTTVFDLPLGTVAKWRAFKSNEHGLYYYENAETHDCVWEIPGLLRRGADNGEGEEALNDRGWWLQPGSAAMAHGLKDGERYNGQAGLVLAIEGGRALLKLPDCLAGLILRLRPRCVQPLARGTIVTLHGLSQTAALNGEVGTVEDVDHNQSRYRVKMRDGTLKSVKGTKVIPQSRLWFLDLRASCSSLQWRYEQECTFVSSDGHHHQFRLHLPLEFEATHRESRDSVVAPKWPLIVYLHGNGGGSFLISSKRALRTVGLQFAASKFVIVSPVCDWSWRDSPRQWVTELVTELRIADWIDHQRVYLTGCSMGGMGTWELSAARPDLYAAIAPVAAYHRAERTDYFAAQLRTTPVLVAHSNADGTCPMQTEERLWHQLAQHGNNKLHVSIGPYDHISMFDRSYCESTALYEWLLMSSVG